MPDTPPTTSTPPPPGTTGAPGERASTRRVFLTALVVLVACVWPFEGEIPNRYVALTRALVERRALSIDPDHASTSDKALVEGRYYAAAAPGPSFVAAPAYGLGLLLGGPWAGVWLATLVLGPLAGATALAAFFRLTARGGRALEDRLWLTAALGAGTFLLPLATVLYAHALTCAVAVLAALACAEARPGPRRAALAGASLACLPLCEYTAALVAAALGLAWVSRLEGDLRARARAGAWLALGALGPALAFAAYHTACFGAPWRTGYGAHAAEGIAVIQATGVAGFSPPSARSLWEVTLGTSRGLFVFAPAVAVAALASLRRPADPEDRRQLALAWGLGVTFLLLHAGRAGDWYAGFSWGPRYQAAALPFWLAPLASRARPAWASAGVRLAAVAGGLVAALGLGTRWPQTLDAAWRQATTFGLQVKWVPTLFGAGRGYDPADAERWTGPVLLGSTAIFAAASLTVLLLWRGHPGAPRRDRWLAGGLGLLAALQLSAWSSSRGRETALRAYLRDRELISFVWHFDAPENFPVAADLALRHELREEAARLARRGLALAPGDERCRLLLALAEGDRPALASLAQDARDPEVRARARRGR